MEEKYIDKFIESGTGEEFLIKATSADTATSAETATNADAIGNVEKYSGSINGKQREGLKIKNGTKEAVIELNDKGNLAFESLSKHLNLESAQGIQIKPTTTIIFDSSRRIANNKGNEINVEAKFDDFDKRTDAEYAGKDGSNEAYAELKIKSRNLDLRCHDHGGIALQIAGQDGHGNENKIKFESDRTSSIGSSGNYHGEGGKGLEFGTFNNEHASLFCGDYRFKGDANVYGVTRGAIETTSTGKMDYPTQGDDFKDIKDENKKATWYDIINAAKRCADLTRSVKEEIQAAAIEGVEVNDIVTRSNVEEIVNDAISDAHIDLTGVATEEWVLDQHYISELPDAVQYLKMGKSKGNFAIDVKGKYTWEETGPKSATTVDEYNNVVVKGDRVIKYINEAFYTNEAKVYYKAGMDTTLADGETAVAADTIVYNPACNLTFAENCGYEHYEMGSGEESYYEDPTKFAFKAKVKNAPLYSGATYPQFSGATTVPNKTMLPGSAMTEDEVAYYESLGAQYDEEGNVVVAATWERVDIWKKSTLWSMNEININLESDSKIKFDGKKIETVWAYPEVEGGDDVDHKMAEILLSTESLAADANEVVFEQKISKNGDRSGQDTEMVYTFGNNVADTEKVADFAEFKVNYNSKHKNHGKSDEELQAMYDAFLAEGPSFEIRVKVSELLSLVNRVTTLENTITELTNRIETLEGYHTGE